MRSRVTACCDVAIPTPSTAGSTITNSPAHCTSALPVGTIPPCDPERATLLARLHQPPQSIAPLEAAVSAELTPAPPAPPAPSCWSLALIRTLCPELAEVTTDSGAWRRLRRWGISWKAGRPHLISPDPEYESKCAAIAAALKRALLDPLHIRILFLDEMSFYRRPAPGREWHEQGRGGCMQPTVPQAPGPNTRRRIIGALDACDGRVSSMTRSSMQTRAILKFIRQLRAGYGPDVHLILVWDNWPPHHQEDVRALAAELKMEILYTPTYAPWTNYIEKLWKKVRRDVLWLHRFSDAWVELRRRVNHYLDALDRPNPELLRYVGLSA